LNTIRETDPEISILQNIRDNPGGLPLRQRDLARAGGVSLGMTNAIIRRMTQKGWIVVRRINKRNIRYAVSPAGLEEIARRSYAFLRRTISNVVLYRDGIEKWLLAAKAAGHDRIVLVGRSDLDFMLAYECLRLGLAFSQAESPAAGGRGLILFSEQYSGEGAAASGSTRLHDILTGS
jgi:hypothetical protein